MTTERRNDIDKLNACRLKIKTTLKVQDVLDYLIQCQIMTMSDKQSILKRLPDTDEQHALALLEFLEQQLKKEIDVLPSFIDALKAASYRQLATDLEYGYRTEGTAECHRPDMRGKMTPQHIKAITKNMRQIGGEFDAEHVLDYFRQEGLFTQAEVQAIRRCNPATPKQRTTVFLDYLFQKSDKAYSVFVIALKKEGYINLAEAIEREERDEHVPQAPGSGGALNQEVVETMGRMNVGDNTDSASAAGGMPTLTGKHVMISYCHKNENVVKKIHAGLAEKGFKLWVDWEKMDAEPTLNDAMAKAVENSYVFLMCFSKPYKDSMNCKSEAQYAREKKIPILSLRVEAGYNPDGWLGIVNAGNLWVDFSKPKSVKGNIEALATKIRGIKQESAV